MEEKYYPGLIIVCDESYPEAAEWCNNNNCFIEELEREHEEDERQFIIKENPKPELNDVKQQKYQENDAACENFRVSQRFTVTFDKITLTFATNRQTQMDLQTALVSLNSGVSSYIWTDELGIKFKFTNASHVAKCLNAFMEKCDVYDKWTHFKELIDKAQTVEEVVSIVINYEG